MKTGSFNLYLVNTAPGNQYYWGEGTMYAVGNHLRNYFERIMKHPSCPFANFNYSWERGGSVQPTDLVIYFLKSPKSSLIKGQAKHVGSGATFKSPTGMISEVYLSEMEGDGDYSKLVANIAFHELMHNKIDAAVSWKNIHAGASGLAAAVVSSGSQLTDKNVSAMAQAMKNKNPQHVETMYAQTAYLY